MSIEWIAVPYEPTAESLFVALVAAASEGLKGLRWRASQEAREYLELAKAYSAILLIQDPENPALMGVPVDSITMDGWYLGLWYTPGDAAEQGGGR